MKLSSKYNSRILENEKREKRSSNSQIYENRKLTMANLKPSNTIYIHTHEPKSRKKFTRSNICNHLICLSTSKNETRINPRKKERRKEEKKKNRQFEFSLTYGNTLTNLKQLLSEYTRFVDTGVRIYYGKRREHVQVPFTPKNDGE